MNIPDLGGKTEKKKQNRRRHEFLLTFFDNDHKYTEKEVNGYWLVKQLSGSTGRWQVAIYGKVGFGEYKRYQEVKMI